MLEPAREKGGKEGKEDGGRKERKKESHARTRIDARKVLMTTALPHYARDSRAFFPPLAPPYRCSSNRGTRKKNDRASSSSPLDRDLPPRFYSRTKNRGNRATFLGIALVYFETIRTRERVSVQSLISCSFFFFLIQKSNFNQIFLPIIDQCHRKILAVHRLYPPSPSSPAKRISATPHRKQNNRASTKPQFDRSASWSVNRATIFVLARNPCSGEGGERSVILIVASFYHPTKSNAQQ